MTGSTGWVRVLIRVARSVGLVVGLPVFYAIVFLRERKRELALERQPAPSDPQSALDKEQVIASASAGHDAAWVVPLTELLRAGGVQSGELLRGGNLYDRFMVMNRVVFSYEVTAPVGGWTFPHPILAGTRFVPDGFVTDFASIPSLVRWIVGHPLGSYNRAAIVHDFAYIEHPDRSARGRKDCDRAMLRLMAQDGTEVWRRSLIYVGLRIGGGGAYATARERSREWKELILDERVMTAIARARTFILTYMSRRFESHQLLPPGTTQGLESAVTQAYFALAQQGEAARQVVASANFEALLEPESTPPDE